MRGDRTPSLGTATKLARGLRELRDDADSPQYFGLIANNGSHPTARVEYALRADDLLNEPHGKLTPKLWNGYLNEALALVGQFGMNDQYALNIFSRGDYTALSWAWNAIPYQEPIEGAKLLHWAGQFKPWAPRPVRAQELWKQYELPLDKLIQQASPPAGAATPAPATAPAEAPSTGTAVDVRSRDGARGRDRDSR